MRCDVLWWFGAWEIDSICRNGPMRIGESNFFDQPWGKKGVGPAQLLLGPSGFLPFDVTVRRTSYCLESS